jgi:hypothetical protein
MNLTALSSLSIILSLGQFQPPVEPQSKTDVVVIENALIAAEVERASGAPYGARETNGHAVGW